MFKFIKKILFFFIGLAIVYFVSFVAIDYILNDKPKENSIFIWGDSQTYQGIDMKTLHNLTNFKIYSAAQHGAGVYDFYVFAQKVPKNSIVVVGFSIPSLMRSKYLDRNSAGFSINGLKYLFENNYNLKELLIIIKKNFLAKSVFHSAVKLFPNADTIIYNYPISRFKEMFSSSPSYLFNKQNIYYEGVKLLIKKKCKTIFVQFPLHKGINDIYEISAPKIDVDKFKQRIINNYNVKLDTVVFETDENTMYDLTHYNSLGAKLATQYIYEQYLSEQINRNQFAILLNK